MEIHDDREQRQLWLDLGLSLEESKDNSTSVFFGNFNADNLDNKKSIVDYMFMIGECYINWKSIMQSFVTLFTRLSTWLLVRQLKS